ncbi:cytochrome b-c1 complex subunit 8 [Hyla sarda]|uniref:cytochrome b-c1 complex subunit 8 n=1 Tax=Hyla sarda TaxID=327740 RepID=UPI0024C233EF|nr:cytochrome b-c1 complex subunit 8 [Hyla sarda]XP_056425399.1 cytochrome b-c1 complex subunit 8 [Hyla sarda]
MGLHFGDLAKVRHVITFTLSPFEQRAFANALSKGIPNIWRRFSSNFLTIVPPFALAYLTYNWGTHEHQRLKRKDPSVFENDQ